MDDMQTLSEVGWHLRGGVFGAVALPRPTVPRGKKLNAMRKPNTRRERAVVIARSLTVVIADLQWAWVLLSLS